MFLKVLKLWLHCLWNWFSPSGSNAILNIGQPINPKAIFNFEEGDGNLVCFHGTIHCGKHRPIRKLVINGKRVVKCSCGKEF